MTSLILLHLIHCMQDHMFVHIMPISYGLTLTFRLGSVLATLSVTLERFFAIVFPLKNVRRLKRWLIPGSVILTGKWTFKEDILYRRRKKYSYRYITYIDTMANFFFSNIQLSNVFWNHNCNRPWEQFNIYHNRNIFETKLHLFFGL